MAHMRNYPFRRRFGETSQIFWRAWCYSRSDNTASIWTSVWTCFFSMSFLAKNAEKCTMSSCHLMSPWSMALRVPRNAWAYMYDGNLPGIGAHADDSQLQINIYVTPSEARIGWRDHVVLVLVLVGDAQHARHFSSKLKHSLKHPKYP